MADAMRYKIASVVASLRAVDYDEIFPNDYETADAIIAALPDMIPPLVWEKADKRHFDKGHCYSCAEEISYLGPLDWYRIYPASNNEWRWVRQFRMTYIAGNMSNDPELNSAEAAKAAANAHRVAQWLAALGIEQEGE